MYKKYIYYIIFGLAIAPALWMGARAVYLHSHRLTPEDKLHLIAERQGWRLDDVEAKNQAWGELETNGELSPQLWQKIVKASDRETNGYGFISDLIIMFGHYPIRAEYRDAMLSWCRRSMRQTNDPYAAILGYYGYVRAGGPDRQMWSDRLKGRGSLYEEEIPTQDKLAERVKKRLDAQASGNTHQLP